MDNDIERVKESMLARLAEGSKRSVKNVSHEDYVREMKKVRAKDQVLVREQSKKQLESDLAKMSKIIPTRFSLATAIHIKEVAERLDRLEKGTGLHKTSLIFSGVVGAGKTWLAYGYVLDAIKRGILSPSEIEIMTESTLSAISRSGYAKDEKLQELFNENKRFYLVDDVGQAHFRDESMRNEIWFDLVDHIYRNNLTLALTTNLPTRGSSNPLNNYLGHAVYSRLMSLTGGDIVTPGQMDRRPEVFTAMEDNTYGPRF